MPDAKDTDWTVAANEAKSEVLIFATWAGTHTVGDSPAGGGPTGKSTSTHFVYKLHFDSAGKIDSLTNWSEADSSRQNEMPEGALGRRSLRHLDSSTS